MVRLYRAALLFLLDRAGKGVMYSAASVPA